LYSVRISVPTEQRLTCDCHLCYSGIPIDPQWQRSYLWYIVA